MTCAIRGQILLTVILLGGYWAILQYVPVPGGAAGVLTPEGNLSGYLDRTLLPGKILPQYYGHGDNEGILSTIPAVATTLLGVLAGHWLRSGRRAVTTVAGLVVTGVAFVWLGWFWHSSFPVIKNLWTSSFVLVAGGYSLLLLAAFYTVIDVLGFRLWAFFFIVIGVNAITIYVAQRIIDFPKIAEFFVGGVARYSGDYRLVVMAAATLLLKWLFLWFLYQKQVFLRV